VVRPLILVVGQRAVPGSRTTSAGVIPAVFSQGNWIWIWTRHGVQDITDHGMAANRYGRTKNTGGLAKQQVK
jgi:hypothetical protein